MEKDVNEKGLVPLGTSPSEAPLPIHVYALNPEQMAPAQQNLINWTKQKIAWEKKGFQELSENLAIAKKNKWRTTTLKRHTDIAKKKVDYYTKIKMALEAGYIMIPNFPVDAFAVRTDKEYLPGDERNWKGRIGVPSKSLPAGKGEYVSADAKVGTRQVRDIEKKNGVDTEVWRTQWYATDFQDVEFPVTLVKPEILEATQRALQAKIFDEIGLVGENKKSDPIVVGQIFDPTSSYAHRMVTFFVAWWIETSRI